jgi:predicted phosphoribosyltransferase
VNALREKEPAKIVVAIPVCAPETCREMQKFADEVIALSSPEWFHGVGQFYDDFSQTTDEEVRRLLASAQQNL